MMLLSTGGKRLISVDPSRTSSAGGVGGRYSLPASGKLNLSVRTEPKDLNVPIVRRSVVKSWKSRANFPVYRRSRGVKPVVALARLSAPPSLPFALSIYFKPRCVPLRAAAMRSRVKEAHRRWPGNVHLTKHRNEDRTAKRRRRRMRHVGGFSDSLRRQKETQFFSRRWEYVRVSIYERFRLCSRRALLSTKDAWTPSARNNVYLLPHSAPLRSPPLLSLLFSFSSPSLLHSELL